MAKQQQQSREKWAKDSVASKNKAPGALSDGKEFNKKKSPTEEEVPPDNKVARLFTYLEKALALDDTVIRDFRTAVIQPSPWWIADLPDDAENLSMRTLDTDETDEGTNEMGDVWLRVEKKNIDATPDVPKSLREWIEDITPISTPTAKEKIDRKIPFDLDPERVQMFRKFRKEFQQGDRPPAVLRDWVVLNPSKYPEVIDEKYEEDRFTDHPELKSLLKAYTENEWKPWSEKVLKTYKANLLYDHLYALRLLLKNEGDSFEILWGHNMLTWEHWGVGTIYSPIFLTPMTLEFDATKRVMVLSPDPLLKGFVELSALHEMNNQAEMDLITWADRINASPFDFWHYQSLKAQSRFLVNNLSPDGADEIEEEIVAGPGATKVPTIWNAPVIFARKRTNDLWSKYAGLIRRDLEQNDTESTPFIRDLVGDYEESTSGDAEGDVRETSLRDVDLYFPLPWNDEQKRIAERMDAHYGVVVKGPPGTGKSHTIANLISRCLAQGQTVLVTSQTSKALEVLRDKLPENIRSLAVSQLNQTARRDDVLQQSISEISSNLGERHTKFDESKSDRVKTELRQVRQEKASLGNDIRKYILTDSQIHIVIDGVETKPMEAAKFVAQHKDSEDIAWFTDEVAPDAELKFTKENLEETYTILTELDKDERTLHGYELPGTNELPAEDTVAGAFAAFKDHSAQAKASSALFKKSIPGLDKDKLLTLWHQLSDARKTLLSIGKKYEKEIFEMCSASEGARTQWRSVLDKISEKVKTIADSGTQLLGHDVTGDTKLSMNDLIDAVAALRQKTKGGSRIGTFSKLLLSSDAKRVMDTYRIDGRIPDTAERVELLHSNILVQQATNDVKTLLRQGFSSVKSPIDVPDAVDVIQLEVLVTSLKRVVEYCDSYRDIAELCKKTKQLADLSYTKLADVERLTELLSSDAARYELANLEKTFAEWIETLEQAIGEKTHVSVVNLIAAIQKRSVTAWKKAVDELIIARDNKQKAFRLKELTDKIKKQAPNLFSDIVGLADYKEPFKAPDNLHLAWKVARLGSWLDEIHAGIDIDALQARMERLTQKEYQLNSELVTILAWQRQIDRVSKRQRDALMAWSLAMKKYGKGTGKYAQTHLRAAQEALKEAKNAVPVWIMPLHRAAQMFSEPKPGMFDVVIFDEASQCDIKGITIGYLGKKLLVVGDPEQISPAGIFQNQEKVFELISRFLHDIPFKDTFSVTSSLFDIAKIRLSNIIQLNEHFRCVPEIIAFSNHHIYEGKLKPLRYPNPKGMLKPALVPVFVKDGYQNTNGKVNEPEAQAIVAKLIECLNDPKYQLRPDGKPCTFGIISLLAEDQGKYIIKLLRNEIAKGTLSEKTMEERHIEVGDAYKFQGDERDVIFLSMVRALDPNDENDTIAPLTNEDAKRRFNVAASRARDQMFLFHSVPIEALGNKSDWRYKLLAWFYDPKEEELNAGRAALKKEFDSGNASQFSYDVGNLLIDRGYQVVPEYPVIGYRIDLVVQGAETRLAVECDGDQYHTLERWEEDQSREQQLRRAGWIFWRVTGSAFYRHKENALDSLWTKLNELDIKPLVEQ